MDENITEEKPVRLNTKFATAEFTIWDQSGNSYLKTAWSPDDVDKLESGVDFKKYKEIIKQCRFYYRKDPIAGTVINKQVEIGITELVLDTGEMSPNEQKIYESALEDLQKFMEECAIEYLITGLVVPEIKYEAVTKPTLESHGIKKYTSLTLPVSMWLRDSATIKINSTFMTEPSYFVEVPDELAYFIRTEGTYQDGTKDVELYRKLAERYPDFVRKVKNNEKYILLENDLIIRRKAISDSPYPTSYLSPVLEALKHKRNLRRMDYSIAARVIGAIQLFRLGSDEFPVTEDDEDAFTSIQNQMHWRRTANRSVERVFQLFANHTLQIDWIFPDVDALLSEKKYDEVNQDIFFGLGFPRILTTGETQRTGSSDPEFATLSPVKTMENMQRALLPIAKSVIQKISENNKLKSTPEIRFRPINLHSLSNFVDAMTYLYDSGNISRTSLAEAFGFNWEDETLQKEEENKLMKEKKIGEFAPQPFSPQPKVPGQPNTTPGKEPQNQQNTNQNQ